MAPHHRGHARRWRIHTRPTPRCPPGRGDDTRKHEDAGRGGTKPLSPKRLLAIAKRLTRAADLFGDGVGITKLLKDAARALNGVAGRDLTTSADPLYLVWSNEHRAWWAPDQRGYTRIIERAGRYQRDVAFEIAGKRGGGWQVDANPYEIAIPEADAIAQFKGLAA